MDFAWLLILKGVWLAALVASVMSLAFTPPIRHRNCTNCPSLLGANINHIKRIERIKQEIIVKLGFKKDNNGKIMDVFSKQPREGPSRDQKTEDVVQNDEAEQEKPLPPPRVSEEIILSELAGKFYIVFFFAIALSN